MNRYYPAHFTTWPGETGYTVTFPDLPGCISQGDTLEDAMANAEEALQLYTQDNEVLPAPAALANTTFKAEANDARILVATLLVAVVLPGKVLRYNITMQEGLMSVIDQKASALGLSRSGFLAEAARHYLHV